MKPFNIIIVLFLVLCPCKMLCASEVISENEISIFISKLDKIHTEQDLTLAESLYSQNFKYIMYYPTVSPPGEEIMGRDQFLKDLESAFSKGGVFDKNKTTIVSFREIMDQTYVKVSIETLVKYNGQNISCCTSGYYFLIKNKGRIKATRFDGVAECYSK